MKKLSKNKTFFQKLKKLFFPFYKSKDIKEIFKILVSGDEVAAQQYIRYFKTYFT